MLPLLSPLLAALGVPLVAPALAQTPVYQPRADSWAPGGKYPRIIQLRHSGAWNGTLLVTCEQNERLAAGQRRDWPIFQSRDDGKTWSQYPDSRVRRQLPIPSVQDTRNGWGLEYQPQLFELPQASGPLPAGTLLCAGMTRPATLPFTPDTP